MPSNCWKGEEPRKSKQCLIDGGDYIRKEPLAFGQGEQTKWSVALLGMEEDSQGKKLLSWTHCISQRKGPDRVKYNARYDTQSAISCPGYLYQTEMPADKGGVLMEGSLLEGGGGLAWGQAILPHSYGAQRKASPSPRA